MNKSHHKPHYEEHNKKASSDDKKSNEKKSISYDIFLKSPILSNPTKVISRCHENHCPIAFAAAQGLVYAGVIRLKLDRYIMNNEKPNLFDQAAAIEAPVFNNIVHDALIAAGRLQEADTLRSDYLKRFDIILNIHTRREKLVEEWNKKLVDLYSLFEKYFGKSLLSIPILKPFVEENDYFSVFWTLDEVILGNNSSSIAEIVTSILDNVLYNNNDPFNLFVLHIDALIKLKKKLLKNPNCISEYDHAWLLFTRFEASILRDPNSKKREHYGYMLSSIRSPKFIRGDMNCIYISEEISSWESMWNSSIASSELKLYKSINTKRSSNTTTTTPETNNFQKTATGAIYCFDCGLPNKKCGHEDCKKKGKKLHEPAEAKAKRLAREAAHPKKEYKSNVKATFESNNTTSKSSIDIVEMNKMRKELDDLKTALKDKKAESNAIELHKLKAKSISWDWESNSFEISNPNWRNKQEKSTNNNVTNEGINVQPIANPLPNITRQVVLPPPITTAPIMSPYQSAPIPFNNSVNPLYTNNQILIDYDRSRGTNALNDNTNMSTTFRSVPNIDPWEMKENDQNLLINALRVLPVNATVPTAINELLPATLNATNPFPNRIFDAPAVPVGNSLINTFRSEIDPEVDNVNNNQTNIQELNDRNLKNENEISEDDKVWLNLLNPDEYATKIAKRSDYEVSSNCRNLEEARDRFPFTIQISNDDCISSARESLSDLKAGLRRGDIPMMVSPHLHSMMMNIYREIQACTEQDPARRLEWDNYAAADDTPPNAYQLWRQTYDMEPFSTYTDGRAMNISPVTVDEAINDNIPHQELGPIIMDQLNQYLHGELPNLFAHNLPDPIIPLNNAVLENIAVPHEVPIVEIPYVPPIIQPAGRPMRNRRLPAYLNEFNNISFYDYEFNCNEHHTKYYDSDNESIAELIPDSDSDDEDNLPANIQFNHNYYSKSEINEAHTLLNDNVMIYVENPIYRQHDVVTDTITLNSVKLELNLMNNEARDLHIETLVEEIADFPHVPPVSALRNINVRIFNVPYGLRTSSGNTMLNIRFYAELCNILQARLNRQTRIRNGTFNHTEVFPDEHPGPGSSTIRFRNELANLIRFRSAFITRLVASGHPSRTAARFPVTRSDNASANAIFNTTDFSRFRSNPIFNDDDQDCDDEDSDYEAYSVHSSADSTYDNDDQDSDNDSDYVVFSVHSSVISISDDVQAFLDDRVSERSPPALLEDTPSKDSESERQYRRRLLSEFYESNTFSTNVAKYYKDLLLDSGCNMHVVGTNEHMANYVLFSEDEKQEMYMGGLVNHSLKVIGKGDIGILKNVLHVEGVKRELVSIPILMQENYFTVFLGDRSFIYNDNNHLSVSATLSDKDMLVHVDKVAQGPSLKQFTDTLAARLGYKLVKIDDTPKPIKVEYKELVDAVTTKLDITEHQFYHGSSQSGRSTLTTGLTPMELLHNRFNHVGGNNKIKQAVSNCVCIGLQVSPIKLQHGGDYNCPVCSIANFKKLPMPPSFNLHADMHQFIFGMDLKENKPTSLQGNNYMNIIVHYATDWVYRDFGKTKSDCISKLLTLQDRILTPLGLIMKVIRSDSEPIYKSKLVREYCALNGIKCQNTAPYRHEGLIESNIYRVVAPYRAIMLKSQLHGNLVEIICNTIDYMMNCLPNSKLPTSCPITAITGEIPDVSSFREIGQKVYIGVAPEEREKHLDTSRGRPGIVVGLSTVSKNTYIVLDVGTQVLSERYDVVVAENWDIKHNIHLWNNHPNAFDKLFDDLPEILDVNNDMGDIEEYKEVSDVPEATMDIPITTADPSPIVLPRRSTRVPISNKIYQSNNIDIVKDLPRIKWIEGMELPPVPSSPKDFNTVPKYAAYWLEADAKEKAKMFSTTVPIFQRVYPADFPDGRIPKAFKSGVIRRVNKEVIEGAKFFDTITQKQVTTLEVLIKFKSRMVAKGYSQIVSIHYEKNSSPAVYFRSLLVIMHIAKILGWHKLHLDIYNAFLEALADKELYMELPKEWTEGERIIVRLIRNIYGLKQAGLLWYIHLKNILCSLGYKRSEWDPCVFIKDGSFMAVHVDDEAIFCNSLSELATLQVELSKLVKKVTNQGALNRYIGIDIKDEGDRVAITQQHYIEENYSKKFTDCIKSPPHVPFSNLDDLDVIGDGTLLPLWDRNGQISWVAHHTRPDIQCITGIMAKYAPNPSEIHYKAMDQMEYYLYCTRNQSLYLGGKDKEIKLFCYADVSHVRTGDSKFGRYSADFYLSWDSGSVYSYSKSNKNVHLHSTDAEIDGFVEAVKSIIWFRGLLSDLGHPQLKPTVIFQDNKSAIALAENESIDGKSRHINNKLNFLHECAERKIHKAQWISSKYMVSDQGTKLQDRASHEFCTHKRLVGHDNVRLTGTDKPVVEAST